MSTDKSAEDCELLGFDEMEYLEENEKYYIRGIDWPDNLITLATLEKKEKDINTNSYVFDFLISYEETDDDGAYDEEIEIKMYENNKKNKYQIYNCNNKYTLKGGKKMSAFRRKHKSRKYKTRKYKTRKYKSRKYKTRKYKSRK
jgi:hypothetical protein